ncbi:hypothetical protein SAMN05216354_2111 [Xylanibacter ruminicola]|uniref:Uncharacterized protein n=1 Tax=Xylanibacter ruminicola TaxID=839 RepID=A0A1H5VZC8_XYLRU|nr:hypothetical protein [Xylanibacter ruminicola]SEF91917.1 hypothetical protein SAMN05216354_2111 [Xylanibacter ruminicola]
MKRIINILTMAAFAVVFLNSCQDSEIPEEKKGKPLTIHASIDTPQNTRTAYELTSTGMTVSWNEEEAITVISFDESGITAVDKFFSTGEKGRKKADFSGTWTGNEGDQIICLYPDIDSYAGTSLFDDVKVGFPFIILRELTTPLGPLEHEDPSTLKDADVMVGEVTIHGDFASVNLKHQISIFEIEATCKNLGWTSNSEKINTIKISAKPNDDEEDEDNDVVFARRGMLHVTTEEYTGNFFATEFGSLSYYLNDSGHNSDFNMSDGEITQTFYAPVFFEGDLEEGYTLKFQFGGNAYIEEISGRDQIDVFEVGDKAIKLTEKYPLERGKIYRFKVTI